MPNSWLIPLLIGFGFNAASAFTTAYSRWWGDRAGRVVTALLRNVLGIPVWVIGLLLAASAPSGALFTPPAVVRFVGWTLMSLGALLQVLALAELRHKAAAPSIHDTLVRGGPYGRMRHPIYAGLLLEFAAIALLQPRLAVWIACGLGVGWAVLQARLEELDLLQRLPEYRDYMARVPRFLPRTARSG